MTIVLNTDFKKTYSNVKKKGFRQLASQLSYSEASKTQSGVFRFSRINTGGTGSNRIMSRFNLKYVAERQGKSLFQQLGNIESSSYIIGFDSVRWHQLSQTYRLL